MDTNNKTTKVVEDNTKTTENDVNNETKTDEVKKVAEEFRREMYARVEAETKQMKESIKKMGVQIKVMEKQAEHQTTIMTPAVDIINKFKKQAERYKN